MLTLILRTTLILASYFSFAVYHIRAYAYCQNILTPVRERKAGSLLSLAVSFLALSLTLFCGLPVLISLIVIYFMVVLQFLYFFRGELAAHIFMSGVFMFHIMNVKMAVTSTFLLIYDAPSYQVFRENGLSVPCAFVTILLLLISLEVFQKVIDLSMIQILMKNRSQLRFVTSSMMLINVYLLILSVVYNDAVNSGLAGIFLLSTALLLFGAFYTSFWHGVKMSVMVENEIRSQLLEEQLQATREDMEELQAFAFTDTLTAVHNRRFGLEELERLLREQVPFCLCFLDVDHLKYVNDTFGHDEGDRYLLDVVKAFSGALGKGETLSRMGGDEFMLLLPEVPQTEAVQRLREIAAEVSRIPSVYHPSVSFGIVEVGAASGMRASHILQQADREMYQYKKLHHGDGRNRERQERGGP